MTVNFRKWVIVTLLVALFPVDASATLKSRRLMGLQGINLRRLQIDSLSVQASRQPAGLLVQDSSSSVSDYFTEFTPHYFEQPLDHFQNTSQTFEQRYWFSTRHYVPGSGGPVIVLDGGETSGEDRLPFLDTG